MPLLPRSAGLAVLRSLCTLRHDNFYTLLGVRESLHVDPCTLSARFKHLQRQWHPDKFGRSPPPQQAAAAAMSARLNEAYATLRAPDRRAKHLLALRAPDVAVGGELEPEFLRWVMELREQVEEGGGETEVKREAARVKGECEGAMKESFQRGDWGKAAEQIGKLQYLRRIEEAIEER